MCRGDGKRASMKAADGGNKRPRRNSGERDAGLFTRATRKSVRGQRSDGYGQPAHCAQPIILYLISCAIIFNIDILYLLYYYNIYYIILYINIIIF